MPAADIAGTQAGGARVFLDGVTGRPTQVDQMILPPEQWGVRCISIGYFIPENEAVIWRGPMLHRTLNQFLTDVYFGDFYAGTPAYWAVVFEKEVAVGNRDIYVKLVRQDGTLLTTNPVALDTSVVYAGGASMRTILPRWLSSVCASSLREKRSPSPTHRVPSRPKTRREP